MSATRFDFTGAHAAQLGSVHPIRLVFVDAAGEASPISGAISLDIYASEAGGTPLFSGDFSIASHIATLTLSESQVAALSRGRYYYRIRQVDTVNMTLLGGRFDVMPPASATIDLAMPITLNVGALTLTITVPAIIQGATTITTSLITDMTAAGRAIAIAADAAAQRTAMGAAAASHTHTVSQLSDASAAGRTFLQQPDAAAQRTALSLGTAALLNAPATGNAASGELVKGDDTRLAGSTLAIGASITGATANRIFQTAPAGTTLQQQGTWFFDLLGFGAIMPTQQVLRTSDTGGGFIGQIGGGILIGRPDTSPEAFIGAYSGALRGIFIYPGSGYHFGNNTNDLRSSDAALKRRAANVIEGASLAHRTYTVASMPTDTATWIDCTIIVTNSSRGRKKATSDGTNWRFDSDGVIVS